MKQLFVLSLMATLSAGTAWAQSEQSPEGETAIKIEDLKEKNKVAGDIDQEITNARMRAESGSKSKWSLTGKLNYTGGALARPFGQDRPNLAGEPGMQRTTSADIGLDGRFRFTKNDSVTFGANLAMMTPFQGDVDPAGNQLNVLDPTVGYNRTFSAGGLQNSLTLEILAGTSDEARSVERLAQLYLSYTTLKAIDRLTAGVSFSVMPTFYGNDPGERTDDPETTKPGFYGGDDRTDLNVGIYPFAEYAFNDKYSARTVFGYFNWRHLYGDDNRGRLLQTHVYQSVGVGMALSRDFYLYPNVQFVPDNIRSDFTNVALNATINVF